MREFHVETKMIYGIHTFLNAWKSHNSIVVSTEPKIIIQNFSFGNTVHELDQFKPVEINVTNIITHKILEIFMIWLENFCFLLTKS